MPALARARRQTPQQPEGYSPLRPIEGRPPKAERARRFTARLSDGSACVESVEAGDFLQAALTFAETCATHDGAMVGVAVTDADTGETHCFNISLD